MAHWRLVVGVLAGLAAWAGAYFLTVPVGARVLIGWNTGAALYVALMWRLFVTAPEAQVRSRAARQDEARGVILLLVLVAIAASLAAILAALMTVKNETAQAHLLVDGLAALTLVMSWAVLQTIFVVHYAHRHFHALITGSPAIRRAATSTSPIWPSVSGPPLRCPTRTSRPQACAIS